MTGLTKFAGHRCAQNRDCESLRPARGQEDIDTADRNIRASDSAANPFSGQLIPRTSPLFPDEFYPL